MTTANKITIARMILVPVFVVVLLLDFKGSRTAGLVIFIAASLTDFLDGYVARHYNQCSNFGKFMDPLADKLLITSALLIFVQWGQMPAWAAIVIIAREFAVTGLRLVAAAEGLVIAAAWSGKIKTASSIVAVCLMLTGLHGRAIAGAFTVDTLCWIVMTVLTVLSGVEYFIKNGKVLNTKA